MWSLCKIYYIGKYAAFLYHHFYFHPCQMTLHFILLSAINKIYMNRILNLMSMYIFFPYYKCILIIMFFFSFHTLCSDSICEIHRFIIITKLSEQLNKSHVLLFDVTCMCVRYKGGVESFNLTSFVTHAIALRWSIHWNASVNMMQLTYANWSNARRYQQLMWYNMH